MSERGEDVPSREDILRCLDQRRNWGRWGNDDQVKRSSISSPSSNGSKQLRLVQSGRAVSLARTVRPAGEGAGGPLTAKTELMDLGQGVHALVEHDSVSFHGDLITHVDALCHIWDDKYGMWGGRRPREHDHRQRLKLGRHRTVAQWNRHDRSPARRRPVSGRACPHESPGYGKGTDRDRHSQDVEVLPGDALVVHCDRDAWERAVPGRRYVRSDAGRPGLHASCLEVFRDWDVAALFWDVMEASPNEYGFPLTIHNAIWSFGICLVDNCYSSELSEVCRSEGRYKFLIVLAPIPVEGGSGCAVNPLAIF